MFVVTYIQKILWSWEFWKVQKGHDYELNQENIDVTSAVMSNKDADDAAEL